MDWYLDRREVSGLGVSGLRVFEMGFGTGLNAWLLSEFAERMGLLVGYCGIEKFPLGKVIRDTVDFGFEDICGHWKRVNGSLMDGLFDDNRFFKEHWQRLFDQDYIVLDGGSADVGLMDLKNLNEGEDCGNSMFYKFEGDVMRDLPVFFKPSGSDISAGAKPDCLSAYADYYNAKEGEFVVVPEAHQRYIIEPVACGINLIEQD